MDSFFNPYQSFTRTTPDPYSSRHFFTPLGIFSDRYQDFLDVQALIGAHISTTPGSVSLTSAQSPQSLAMGGPCLGNATPIPATFTDHDVSEPSMQATIDALTLKTEDIAPYEKLYPGFDPEQDVEVVTSWTLAVCKWGSCVGVRRRLDDMWHDHIFANVNKGQEESHKAEMLAPENRLPNGHVKCLWNGCGRTMPVDGLKKHIEDAHLHVYRLRCIHCGMEKRRDAYRDTHGPASKCLKNRHLQQATASPSPPLPLPNLETVIFSLNPVGPPPAVVRHTPYPSIPAVTEESFLEPDPDPNEARSKLSLRTASSPRGPSTDPTICYQESLTKKLNKAMYLQSYFSHTAPPADVPTDLVNTIKRPWAQPAAILAHHPAQHKRMPCPPFAPTTADVRTPVAPHPFTPTCVDPRSLLPRQVPAPSGRRMIAPARDHLPPRKQGDRYEASVRPPQAAGPLPQRVTSELFAAPCQFSDAADVPQAVPLTPSPRSESWVGDLT